MESFFHQSVSPKKWTKDFVRIQSLPPKERSTVGLKSLLSQEYTNPDFVEEYSFRLWNAFVYMGSIRRELEDSGLSVEGKYGGLIKDSVPWALYSHFAACDISACHIMDLVPLDKVIALAKSYET